MEDLRPEEHHNSIIFDSLCIEQLKSTRKWTKFLSLVGFIFIGLMLIIFGLASTQFFNNQSSLLAILPMILLALIYFFPIYFLWQFSVHSKAAIENNDGTSLALAMKFLRRHYASIGTLLIVMIALYLIAGIIMFSTGRMMNPF